MMEMCEPVAGLRVLDIGCGEGYCARALRRRGASWIDGMDLSGGMIAAARTEEATTPLGAIVYHEGDATDLSAFPSESVDLVLAMFLFNYLNVEDMKATMAEIA